MLLTLTANTIAAASLVYFTVGFALHLIACWQRTASAPQIAPQVVSAPKPQQVAAPTVEAAWADAMVPFARKQPSWAELTPEQLRKECQKRNIKWRNARPDGKHLRKSEMVALLSA